MVWTGPYGRGWQKAHKTTSSLALGIHFGHYIAGTFNPVILVINVAMADIPLHTSFTSGGRRAWISWLTRLLAILTWKNFTLFLLFKADFNANNKWIGQAIMYQAEQEHLMVDEPFGSHKFKSAIHQCLNKYLLYDLIRFRHTPAALCLNDTKSYYNRITLLAAALCLCRLGCSQPLVTCMITMIH